ncbi:hypothetical protein L6Q96_08150 [Candidatus Binatia bacterium]|nr:hypothetical protein [Candidatus Binatia bacterium]
MPEDRPTGPARADTLSLAKGLDSDIAMVHQRFLAAMESRLPSMNANVKERYFAVLSNLVCKLEVYDKPLRDVLREIMAESAHLVLRDLAAS